MVKHLVVAVGFSFVLSCAPKDKAPDWLARMVADFRNQAVTNPPRSVWQYQYNNQIVYYLPPICCDQFSVLYNASGEVLCAPDGGLVGNGDGRCPDFIAKRTNEQLVWQDIRK